MKTEIINYYISEKQWSTYGLWIAIAVVTISIILWRTSAVYSLQRGLSYALAVAGLLFTIATSLTIRHNNQRIAQAKQIIEQSDRILQQQETTRMEDVLKNAYKVGLVSFSIASVTGIILLFALKTSMSKGIAVGVLLFGAYGLMMETLSMKSNQTYLKQIKSYRLPAGKNIGSLHILLAVAFLRSKGISQNHSVLRWKNGYRRNGSTWRIIS